MSDLARVIRCSIQRHETPDLVRARLWYADVILENTSDALVELQLDQRLALTYRFVVRDEQRRVVAQKSFVDGNAEFPKITRSLRLRPHEQVRTSFPLLRVLPSDAPVPGRYWVTAVLPVGGEQVESASVEVVLDQSDA